MIRFPLLLPLALLAGSPAFAAPALRLSTTLTTPAGLTAPPHIANALRPALKLDGNAKAGISALVLDKAVAMLGTSYRLGDRVKVRLIEAAPVAGALRFEMLSEGRSDRALGKLRFSRPGPGHRPGRGPGHSAKHGPKPGSNHGTKHKPGRGPKKRKTR